MWPNVWVAKCMGWQKAWCCNDDMVIHVGLVHSCDNQNVHSPNLPYSLAAEIPVFKVCWGKSSAEGNWSVQPELLKNPPWLYIFKYVQLIRTGVVLWSLKGAPVVHCNFPLHNCQNWDCRCMRAFSFGIGDVWWMAMSRCIHIWVVGSCSGSKSDGDMLGVIWQLDTKSLT